MWLKMGMDTQILQFLTFFSKEQIDKLTGFSESIITYRKQKNVGSIVFGRQWAKSGVVTHVTEKWSEY